LFKDPVMRAVCVCSLLIAAMTAAFAQDIRGLENCAAEKQMERRTGCLQSNVEFLQQLIQKTAIETRQKLAAAEKDVASANSQIALANKELAALKDNLGKMQIKLDELQKAKNGK
jgi:septal ring factor EnvC (AmiA/AmiB activator)